MLTICRGTQVDKSKPETEPSWLLSRQRKFSVYYMFLYGMHGLWRILGIDDIPNLKSAGKGYDILSISLDITTYLRNTVF